MQHSVTINLDKQYDLRLTTRKIMEFEKTNKVKFALLGNDLVSFDINAKLLYTLLKPEIEELTLDKTFDLIDEYLTPEEFLEIMNEVIELAFPKSSDKNFQKPTTK